MAIIISVNTFSTAKWRMNPRRQLFEPAVESKKKPNIGVLRWKQVQRNRGQKITRSVPISKQKYSINNGYRNKQPKCFILSKIV